MGLWEDIPQREGKNHDKNFTLRNDMFCPKILPHEPVFDASEKYIFQRHIREWVYIPKAYKRMGFSYRVTHLAKVTLIFIGG